MCYAVFEAARIVFWLIVGIINSSWAWESGVKIKEIRDSAALGLVSVGAFDSRRQVNQLGFLFTHKASLFRG